MIGAGPGGSRPWAVIKPAAIGIPTASAGTFSRLAMEKTRGISSTNVTSKRFGSPISSATTATLIGIQASLRFPMITSASLSPPPDCTSMPPSMDPRAITTPVTESWSPNPSVKVSTALVTPSPLTNPSEMVEIRSASKGWNFARVISRISRTIARTPLSTVNRVDDNVFRPLQYELG